MRDVSLGAGWGYGTRLIQVQAQEGSQPLRRIGMSMIADYRALARYA